MRRMDYPIAKAKELNINDKEWFERPNEFDVYLKKRLPNGVYNLIDTSQLSEGKNLSIMLYGNNGQRWYKALFVIANTLYSINDILPDTTSLCDGLTNAQPYFVIKGGSGPSADDYLCLIVKDDIIFLTAYTDI